MILTQTLEMPSRQSYCGKDLGSACVLRLSSYNCEEIFVEVAFSAYGRPFHLSRVSRVGIVVQYV